jgi:hypothetical protein
MMSFTCRRKLLAGYIGQFRNDGLIGRAIARGNLSEAVSFARQLVAAEPITPAECAEHDLALEFLEEFGQDKGFDTYVEEVTGNGIPASEYSQLDSGSLIARDLLDWIAA